MLNQGDIVLVPKGVQPAVALRFRRWKDGIIPYYIEPNHPKTSEINRAINSLNRNTKLRFRPTTNFGSNFITTPPYGDSYPVLIGAGCDRGVIIHELLHAAGLLHEQSRSDRDNYVIINWSNIQSSYKDDYEKSG